MFRAFRGSISCPGCYSAAMGFSWFYILGETVRLWKIAAFLQNDSRQLHPRVMAEIHQ